MTTMAASPYSSSIASRDIFRVFAGVPWRRTAVCGVQLPFVAQNGRLFPWFRVATLEARCLPCQESIARLFICPISCKPPSEPATVRVSTAATFLLSACLLFVTTPAWAWSGQDWRTWRQTTTWTRPELTTDQTGKQALARLLATGDDSGGTIDSIRSWERKRSKMAAVIERILGHPSVTQPPPLQVEELGSEELDDHVRRHIRIRTERDDWIPAYVLLPKKLPATRLPAMICLHQTVSQGKEEVCGIQGSRGLALALQLVRRGYITIAPDMIGFGERIPEGAQPYDGAAEFYRRHPNWSYMGKMVWDISRVVDYLETLPEVDRLQIGCIGHSHGAYATLFAAALEPRISLAIASCGFTTFRRDPQPQRWSHLTALIPQLGMYLPDVQDIPFDWQHVCALIAPRPLFVWYGLHDDTFPNTDNLPSLFRDVRTVYGLYGAADDLAPHAFDGPHGFPDTGRAQAYTWLQDRFFPVGGLHKLPQDARQWRTQRQRIERLVRRTIGGPCPTQAALDVKVLGSEKLPRYERRLIEYTVAEKERVRAYLALPVGGKRPLPAVLVLHQTVKEGKREPAGLAGDRSLAFADDLARRGYITLAPDSITAGDRIDRFGPFDTRGHYLRHPDLSAMGKMVHDAGRALDVLVATDGVDAERLGAIGHSLGAEEALFLAAFDERLRATVASCGYATMAADADPARWARDHWFSYMPKLRPVFRCDRLPSWDFGDVVRLVAPRGFYQHTTRADAIFPESRSAYDAVEAARPLWQLLGQPDRIANVLKPGKHAIAAGAKQEMYAWLDQQLRAGPAKPSRQACERLGEPCRAKQILGSCIITDREDGRERLVLLNDNEAHGCELLLIDLEHSTGKAYPAPAGSGSWAVLEVPGDRLVVGTFYDGVFMIFDLKKKKFTHVIDFPGETYIWNLALGSDGRVYGGTYPGGKLGALDLKTYTFEDLGAPSVPNQYLRTVSSAPWGQIFANFSMDTSTTKIYDIRAHQWRDVPGLDPGMAFGVGKSWNGYFVAADPRSGKVAAFRDAALKPEQPLPFPVPAGNFTFVPQLTTRETIYLQQNHAYYRFRAGETAKSVTRVADIDLRGGRFVATTGQGDLVGVRGQYYFVHHPGAADLALKRIPVESQGRPPLFLAADGHGHIWGGPKFGQTLFSYNIQTGKTINTGVVCDGGGEVYGVAFHDGSVYTASYASGEITRYDPTRPWNQWQGTNPKSIARLNARGYIRPVAGIRAGPDGKLYAGWMAKYGVYGGAISITDPESGKTELIENPLGQQAIQSFDVNGQNLYIGTRLGANGLPDQKGRAQFGVIDLASRRVRFKQAFAARSVSRIRWEGRSSTVLLVIAGKLCRYDAKTHAIVNDPVPHLPPITSPSMVTVGDGTLLTGSGNKILRIDPAAQTFSIVMEAPVAVERMTLASDRRVYFNHGAVLYRTRMPLKP